MESLLKDDVACLVQGGMVHRALEVGVEVGGSSMCDDVALLEHSSWGERTWWALIQGERMLVEFSRWY